MQASLDFADDDPGIILPRQLDETVFRAITVIDTRSADQVAAGATPSAIDIDWHEVPTRIDEIPDTGLAVLFCNTGLLSAQATCALRGAGRTNAVVLQTGIIGWQETAAYRP